MRPHRQVLWPIPLLSYALWRLLSHSGDDVCRYMYKTTHIPYRTVSVNSRPLHPSIRAVSLSCVSSRTPQWCHHASSLGNPICPNNQTLASNHPCFNLTSIWRPSSHSFHANDNKWCINGASTHISLICQGSDHRRNRNHVHERDEGGAAGPAEVPKALIVHFYTTSLQLAPFLSITVLNS